MREIRVGTIVALALACLVGFMVMAAGGPGYLTQRRTIDVVFRDGQGIRPGSPVRIAGIDAGRVTAVDLVPVDGLLRARVRMALPAALAGRLRQDLKVTIQAGLTGQSLVNVVETGRSEQPLVPGQVIAGVESSFFDPVLEQVGLGPVERSHLSHMIGEVRSMVDATGPQVRAILGSLQETAADVRESAEAVRPAVTVTAGRIEEFARKADTAKLDEGVARVNALVGEAESMLAENRAVLKATLTSVNELTTDVKTLIRRDSPKVEAMLENVNGTRARLDALLTQATITASQSAQILTVNRASIDRTVANVRDATNNGNMLVQKLYGNPFYLSPFYKPTKEDIASQEFYDVASTFMNGAKELHDAVTALQAMRDGKSMTQMTTAEQTAYDQLYKRAWSLQGSLEQASKQLAGGLRNATPVRR